MPDQDAAAAHERNGPPIVVGVDGGEPSKDALRWAARQSELTGSPLEAVMVWNVPAADYRTMTLSPVDADAERRSRRALDATVTDVLGDGAEVTRTVVCGHPATELVRASERGQLLVVGNRGHGAFTATVIGSVSAYCVAHAPCPVVVVHPRS